MSANKIKKPILLIHGEEDNNPGTLTMQVLHILAFLFSLSSFCIYWFFQPSDFNPTLKMTHHYNYLKSSLIVSFYYHKLMLNSTFSKFWSSVGLFVADQCLVFFVNLFTPASYLHSIWCSRIVSLMLWKVMVHCVAWLFFLLRAMGTLRMRASCMFSGKQIDGCRNIVYQTHLT